jgi:hypothetical protein
MHVGLLFVAVFIFGSLLIIFNELVARRFVNRSKDKFNIEINERRARILCIMLGTIYVGYALLSLFGPLATTR